jgi:hypothetical protein
MRTLNVRAEAGQATVELVGFLPLMVALGIGIFSLISAASCAEIAANSAHAGAIAVLQRGDPKTAAIKAIPKRLRKRAAVAVNDGRVSVAVTPSVPIPTLRKLLIGRSSATAGEVGR